MSKEKAADYFSRHQSSNECHITSDGRVFHTKGTADSFANGLKDTKVKSYTRDEKAVEDIDVDLTGTDNDKLYTSEDLKAFDAATADYLAAKDLVKGLGLDVKSKKHADLLEAIALAKSNLQA